MNHVSGKSVNRKRKNSARRIDDPEGHESLAEPERESAEKGAIVVPRTTAVVLIAVCTYLR
jgi:hypothetical protein